MNFVYVHIPYESLPFFDSTVDLYDFPYRDNMICHDFPFFSFVKVLAMFLHECWHRNLLDFGTLLAYSSLSFVTVFV